jgi:hypothetical protein
MNTSQTLRYSAVVVVVPMTCRASNGTGRSSPADVDVVDAAARLPVAAADDMVERGPDGSSGRMVSTKEGGGCADGAVV